MSSTAIELTYPIAGAHGTITALTLRRPRVKDLRAIDEARGELGRTAALVGALTGLGAAEVDQLDGADFLRLAQAAADFFPMPQPTGAP